MKLYRLSIAVLLIFLLPANSRVTAESQSFTTGNVFNGRMWQLLSSAQRIAHLTGIQEGIILCLNQIKEDLNTSSDLMDRMKEAGIFDRRRLLFSSQGVSAIETRVDFFYRDEANINIPISEAYRHVTMELNFATSQELKNNLSVLRYKYSE
jgi:hypothetical protein